MVPKGESYFLVPVIKEGFQEETIPELYIAAWAGPQQGERYSEARKEGGFKTSNLSGGA